MFIFHKGRILDQGQQNICISLPTYITMMSLYMVLYIPSSLSVCLCRNWLEEGVMDKIPEGAESLTVLVGGVKFLSEPIVAFVRLAQVRGVVSSSYLSLPFPSL